MNNGCGRMTDGCRRITDKMAAADFVGKRRRSDGGMMQSSTDMGEDNGE